MAVLAMYFSLLSFLAMYDVLVSGQMSVARKFVTIDSHFCSNESALSKEQITAYLKCEVFYIGNVVQDVEMCLPILSEEPLELREQLCEAELRICIRNRYNETNFELQSETETDDNMKRVKCGSTALGIDLDGLFRQFETVQEEDLRVIGRFCKNSTEIKWTDKGAFEGEKCEYTFYESQGRAFNSVEEALKNAPTMEKCREKLWAAFEKPMTANEKRIKMCDRDENYFEYKSKWVECIRTELKMNNSYGRNYRSSRFLHIKKRISVMTDYVKCMDSAFKQP